MTAEYIPQFNPSTVTTDNVWVPTFINGNGFTRFDSAGTLLGEKLP